MEPKPRAYSESTVTRQKLISKNGEIPDETILKGTLVPGKGNAPNRTVSGGNSGNKAPTPAARKGKPMSVDRVQRREQPQAVPITTATVEIGRSIPNAVPRRPRGPMASQLRHRKEASVTQTSDAGEKKEPSGGKNRKKPAGGPKPAISCEFLDEMHVHSKPEIKVWIGPQKSTVDSQDAATVRGENTTLPALTPKAPNKPAWQHERQSTNPTQRAVSDQSVNRTADTDRKIRKMQSDAMLSVAGIRDAQKPGMPRKVE